ncbi:MAG: D-glycero-beta-D-manno-heptose 1-phosphate adenylyltransferase [Planctomycetes bacterium]|nr:D-glycero-beta-D-manno-heptose 1-phosphate adenylyltransferase [Planctomycetota bacterium]
MSTADLIEIIDALGKPKVAVVGDLILDHYVFGVVSRISPEAPIPVLHVVREEDRLGGAANVAANILSLGGRGSLVGAIGCDEPGSRFRKLAKGLSLSATVTPARPTVLKTRMVSQNQQMLRVDRELLGALSQGELREVTQRAVKAASGVGAVVISDYGKGVITPESAQALIAAATRAGVPVIVDPKGRDYSRYRGAAAVTPNRAEAEAATGIDCGTLDGVREAGKLLCRKLKLKAAVITLSAQGVAVIPARGEMTHFPAQARSVYDVTGAGDTFIAGFALCVAGGADFHTAARIANYAAALKVARFGAVAITREELRRSVISAHEGFDHAGKVVTHDELGDALDEHRKRGERIVFTNGCFDLLHQGHVTYLNFCRGQGDVVVIGLNSDASVRRLKGPTRPVNEGDARARVLAALNDVDYVTLFEDDTPEKLIRKVRPDVLVKGEDWSGKSVAGADFVEASGGRVVFAPLVAGKSTTNLIAKAKAEAPARGKRQAAGGRK